MRDQPSSHTRSPWIRRFSLLLLLPLLLTLVTPPVAGDADSGGIEFVGVIENPYDPRGPMGAGLPLGVFDGRFYALVSTESGKPVTPAAWSTDTEIPTAAVLSPDPLPGFGGVGTGRTTFDTTRNRLTLGYSNPDVGNHILEYDPETLDLIRTTQVAAVLPGFFLRGLTYDEAADRYYLLGEMTAVGAVLAIGQNVAVPATPGPAIVALDAETMRIAWVHELPECGVVLFDNTYGSLLGLSANQDVLYAFCYGGNAASAPSGQSTLLRVFIDADATAADAISFRREVFPISGSYAPGIGAGAGVIGFDAVRERMVVQSRSAATPGGWIFDGLTGAWVGFVAAPNNRNAHMGIDEEAGRYYMGGVWQQGSSVPGYVNVTDVGATPPPQGLLNDRHWISMPMFPDPDSDRIFTSVTLVQGDPPVAVLGEPAFEGAQGQPLNPFVVLRDTTQPITPLPPLDLDGFTVDLPDAKVRQDFTGAAEGFGARYLLVGGPEGITARTSSLAGQPTQTLGLGTGDRGVLLAAVPRVDLRQAGVGATGAVATTDQATVGDAEDTARDVGQNPEVFGFGDGMATCLDGNGDKIESTQESELGTARVVCDLKALSGEVSATANEGLTGGNVSVAGATFDTRTFHDPKRGVVTETTATATGVRVGPKGGPNVQIKRIVAVAVTVANGRPGTTSATWERRVEGVSSASGEVPGGCRTVAAAGKDASISGNCDALAAAINRIAPKELEVTFPLPHLEATPKGAYAAVEEREVDYLDARTLNNDQSRAMPAMQVEVRNDNTEKSRLFIEFAAIRANSTFTRTESIDVAGRDGSGLSGSSNGGSTASGSGGGTSGPLGTPGFLAVDASSSGTNGSSGGTDGSWVGRAPTPSVAGGDGVIPPPQAAAPADGGVGVDVQATSFAPVPAGSGSWLLGRRELSDVAAAAGVWILFGWPLFVGIRRRNLLATT
jgi:hypothetical protein